MAIDTRDKRSSTVGGMPWDWGDGWDPDGVMTQADHQDATETYRGILATTPPAPTGGAATPLFLLGGRIFNCAGLPK